MPPPVPVTVMGYVPIGVLALTVTVIVELPAPGAGIGLGLKLTVVPDGAPEADRLMALPNPPLIVAVIVDDPWLPGWIVTEDGKAEIVKFGCICAVTVSVTVAFCWMPPPFPVT